MRTAVVLDRSSTVPLSRQIYDFWRTGILSGRFSGGERVPSTREVATALDLSRGTIAQAYEQLVSEGYFQASHGSGTFVCSQLPEALLNAPEASGRASAPNSAAPLSSFGKRLQKDIPFVPRQPGHICLSHWGPDLTLFPLEVWHRLYARCLRSLGPDGMDYTEQVPGYGPLRQEIAKYVSRSRGVLCTAEQVIVVNGSQQGLDLCARLLLEPGDEVALENPGYLGARRIFEACGARLRPVPVDREGIECSRLGTTARLVYVTPAHQFPTGVALSLRRRLELVAWARQHGAVIIEDDYDSEYRYSGAPTPALQGLVSEVPVIYCGTFSKVMFPGLRVGYLIVPRPMASAFARAKWLTDRHTPVHQQAALHAFMKEGHLERHIRRMRRIYGLRRTALVEALHTHFGDTATVLGEAAGMHAYVRFNDPDLGARARRCKVQLRDTEPYYIGKVPAGDYLLGFSTLTERSIREGIRRLRHSMDLLARSRH
jgi:GntR family transcriptional regulator / MocR family aminotransferase